MADMDTKDVFNYRPKNIECEHECERECECKNRKEQVKRSNEQDLKDIFENIKLALGDKEGWEINLITPCTMKDKAEVKSLTKFIKEVTLDKNNMTNSTMVPIGMDRDGTATYKRREDMGE